MTFVQLQLLIASTNEQAAEPAVFWSWGGVLAICTGLVVLGFATDWLLRRKHKDNIIIKMGELQEKLERLPVRDWQVAVARGGVRVWDALGEVVPTMGRRLGAVIGNSKWPQVWVSLVMLILLAAGSSYVFLGRDNIASQIGHWSAKALIDGTVFFLLGIVTALFEHLMPSTSRLESLLVLAYTKVFPAVCISMAFTLLAGGLGITLHDCSIEAAWFVCDAASSIVVRPTLLAISNFIFDLATIMLSYCILRHVVRNRRWFVRLAALDIGISGILTVLLHTVLLWLAPERSVGLSDAFPIAWHWFIQVITFSASPTDPNWPLTPILFTTFIPVTLYMSAFLFVGVILKYPAKLVGYLCEQMWDKQQTPFFVFAITLSGMVAFAKVLSEWEWLVDKFGG